MNKIIFTPACGGPTAILHPAPMARLVSAVRFGDDVTEFDPPVPLDQVMRNMAAIEQGKATVIYAETEAEFVQRIRDKDVPAGATNVRIVDEAEIPTDRTFRDAWKHASKGVINVDMPTAIEIHKARLRATRGPLLTALDVDYQRADETGDGAAKARIAADKQRLRDVTKRPELLDAQTPEDLAAVALR